MIKLPEPAWVYFNPMTYTYDTTDGTCIPADMADNVQCLADVFHIALIREKQRDTIRKLKEDSNETQALLHSVRPHIQPVRMPTGSHPVVRQEIPMSKHEELIARLRAGNDKPEYSAHAIVPYMELTMGEAADALEAQAREIEGLRKDAARYRWLRAQDNEDFEFAVVKNPHFDVFESPEELDAAIDAAKGAPNG